MSPNLNPFLKISSSPPNERVEAAVQPAVIPVTNMLDGFVEEMSKGRFGGLTSFYIYQILNITF